MYLSHSDVIHIVLIHNCFNPAETLLQWNNAVVIQSSLKAVKPRTADFKHRFMQRLTAFPDWELPYSLLTQWQRPG